MTQKEFIEQLEQLDEKGYPYKIEGDRIIVVGGFSSVELNSLISGVVFRNGWNVKLRSSSLPPGVEFENKGNVDLSALTSLPLGFHFKNDGGVYLSALTSLPSGVVFKNE